MSAAWKLLPETSQKHLCFGFVRKCLHLMNIDIQVDDIANIIFNYALSLDFGFICNPNYSNVSFTDDKSNKRNDSKSALISPSITCNFNIDSLKLQKMFESNDNSKHNVDTNKNETFRRGHFSSSVLFKPFLSKLLNIGGTNRVTGNHKSIRMNVILQHKNCKANKFDNSGHKLQCGLIAVPKKIIVESFKPKNVIDNININGNINYNCKQIFLDQLETCFSQKVMFWNDHSMELPKLAQKLHQELDNCNDDEDDDNDGIAMSEASKRMSVICITNIKQYDRCHCLCHQPRIKRNDKNDDDAVINYKATDVTYTEESRNFFIQKLFVHQDEYGSTFTLKSNDCIQLYVEYQVNDNEYTIDFKKGLAQDVLKNDFDKGKSLFGKDDIGKFECRKLNFDKCDYLLAIASARCVCKDVKGFQVKVFVEQFDAK